jgi:aerobic-type carbon monoxide dehydrogenase small subunit (CoxS/CutS family)
VNDHENQGLQRVSLRLNGVEQAVSARADETLLETLRDRLSTTSARYCCGIGVCGTCSVLVDDLPTSSCLLLTVMCQGRDVVTAEALFESDAGDGAEVASAFARSGAFQCSYCIPAMALTVHGCLKAEPNSTMEQMSEQLGGNLCRCGSYPQIREALEALVAVDGPARDDERSES